MTTKRTRAPRKGKLYMMEFASPFLFREFKRIAAMNHDRYGDWDDAHSTREFRLWRAPIKEDDFRDLIRACKGVVQVVDPKPADVKHFYEPWVMSHSNEDFVRVQQLALELTDLDRQAGRSAPVAGYSKENFDRANKIVQEARR